MLIFNAILHYMNYGYHLPFREQSTWDLSFAIKKIMISSICNAAFGHVQICLTLQPAEAVSPFLVTHYYVTFGLLDQSFIYFYHFFIKKVPTHYHFFCIYKRLLLKLLESSVCSLTSSASSHHDHRGSFSTWSITCECNFHFPIC